MSISKNVLTEIIEVLPSAALLVPQTETRPIGANRMAITLAGFTADDFEGFAQEYESRICEQDFADYKAAFATLSKGEATHSQCEFRFKKKNGDEIWMLEKRSIALVNADSIEKTDLCLCLIEDITRRKQLEASLLQQRKALEQSAKHTNLGKLAAGISHEVNNPLAIIKGWAENLPLMPENTHLALGKIIDATNRISRIIASLRQLGLDSSLGVMQETNFTEIFGDLIPLIKTKFNSFEIEIRTEILDGAGNFQCKKQNVEQILLALLQNASDAVQGVPADLRKVTLSGTTDENNIVFRIIDTGAGVPDSIRESIFQPFFTTKAADLGTGLGLSVALSLAKSEQGTLELENHSKGTCFALKIPWAK